MDAFEYKQLEAELQLPDTLSEAPTGPGDGACQLPRAAAAQAVTAGTHRPGIFRPARRAEGNCTERLRQRLAKSLREDGPAASAIAREDDTADKENMIEIHGTANPRLSMELKTEEVSVHLYDLSDALAQLNSVAIDLMGFGGALHVGVEVFGVEWSFGTGGVSASMPKQNRHYAYRQTVSMRPTHLTLKEVDGVLLEMQREWRGSEYDLFSKNCGTFCNALCIRLGVGSLPPWVTRLAEAGARSTTVRRIADLMARNGLIGEASPRSQSQAGLSPQGGTSQGGTSMRSRSEFETPRNDASVVDEEVCWFSTVSRPHNDWLEEELAYELRSPRHPPVKIASDEVIPSAPHSRDSAGLSRSMSAFDNIGSPGRGSMPAQRCPTFRANSYPQMNAALRKLAFEEVASKDQAFHAKRLGGGPRLGYSSHGHLMRVAAGGGG